MKTLHIYLLYTPLKNVLSSAQNRAIWHIYIYIEDHKILISTLYICLLTFNPRKFYVKHEVVRHTLGRMMITN